ncbi:BglG family transcription antiterminator [Lacrimispora sp.]|uniref:BglG family transcription antiterminator n=1 Tax=Lacrimispora sp. TaxID=2719234 RepID=UPI002FD8F627
MKDKISDIFLVLSNPRHKIIFLLLLRSGAMISSKVLAEELSVTPRTIKSDIKSMRYDLGQFGIQIASKSSQGYRLVLRDQVQNRRMKEYFQIYQPNTVNDEQKIRVHYIIRRLLSSGEPVKAEQFQRELFLNESNSMHKEFSEVKEFFRMYHIEILARPHYGISIQGELFYKICCMVRMYRYFYKNSPTDLWSPEFNELFYCDETEKGNLRKVLHKTLANSNVVFSDIYSERFLMYLIFFRNYVLKEKQADIEFPELCFDYQITNEFTMVEELIQKLRNLYSGFDFDEGVVKYLTLIAVMSTDLYRFRDCTEERYGGLIKIAEDLRNFVLTELSSYFCVNLFDDYTCFKDLLKIMIPISLKQVLKLSDDVDLGFHDLGAMKRKPVLNHGVKRLREAFQEKYGYQFSKREQYLIFTTILGLFNRLVLPHQKLKLALIAIDGRLSTQQLKFNLQHYFSDFIEKIETKMLYELESMDSLDYDYYLCMEYGRNMNIEYSPIYYASEDLAEKEYMDSLSHVFLSSYRHQDILPPIRYFKIDEKFRFEPFPVEEFENSEYEDIIMGRNHDIRLFLNLNSTREQFGIFYFEDEADVCLYGEKYFLVVDMQINDNSQKLKMMIHVLDRIFETPALLRAQCEKQEILYRAFLAGDNISN